VSANVDRTDFPLVDGLDLPLGAPELEDESAPTALVPAHLVALARRVSRTRRIRDRVFGPNLCVNPPWNILLELFVSAEEGRNITIKSACVAAGVPQSTALRHIAHLIEIGLCVRTQHPNDARSAHLKLTRAAHRQMIDFLRQLADSADLHGE
jgi:hypothetical protein